jgi:predicted MFS family arabinose efflux permease
MFALAGLRDEKVFWGILATGIINLIATLLSLKLIERLGRRPLIVWLLVGIMMIMIVLTVLIVVNVRSRAISHDKSIDSIVSRRKILKKTKKHWAY